MSQTKGMKAGARTTTGDGERTLLHNNCVTYYATFLHAGTHSLKATSSTRTITPKSTTFAPSSPPSGGGGGWDVDDGEWGSFDTTGSSGQTGRSGTAAERQELQQKKREERKLKQQAAREKRAAGMSLKPGLGAVKKD